MGSRTTTVEAKLSVKAKYDTCSWESSCLKKVSIMLNSTYGGSWKAIRLYQTDELLQQIHLFKTETVHI